MSIYFQYPHSGSSDERLTTESATKTSSARRSSTRTHAVDNDKLRGTKATFIFIMLLDAHSVHVGKQRASISRFNDGNNARQTLLMSSEY